MEQLSDLPNIGEEVARQLKEAGIGNYEHLKELGAEAAWLKIQEMDESACIHRLYALEGAIRGIKKSLLPENRKAELREFYNSCTFNGFSYMIVIKYRRKKNGEYCDSGRDRF